MNRFEIRDILNQHKEHFRVLPTLACNELLRIIQAVDDEELATKIGDRIRYQDEKAASRRFISVPDKKPVKKEAPAKSFTTGNVAKKKAKKKSK